MTVDIFAGIATGRVISPPSPVKKPEVAAQKIQNNLYVSSISKGMMQTTPILILGAIVTLLRSFQFEAWQAFIGSPSMAMVLNAIAIFTNGMFALWVLIGISYRMGRNFKVEPFGTVMVSLLSYMIIIPLVVTETGSFINSRWIGTQGVFTAMIVAVLASRFYVFLMDKKVYIKLPESVPPFVERAFANIVPVIIISALSGLVLYLFDLTEYGSFPALTYAWLQIPLTKLGGSYLGVCVAFIVISILWWLGIHGKIIVYGAVFGGIFTVNGIENAEAALSTGAGINYFDMGSVRIFFEHGGAGCILAFVILMAFFAKSDQYKTLGKLFGVPTFFGISEPAIFGTPVVLNIVFLAPMILAPLVSGTIGYLALKLGMFLRSFFYCIFQFFVLVLILP